MPSPTSPGRRRTEILRLLAAEPHTLVQLRRRLQPMPSTRILENDMRVLRAMLPGRLTADRSGRSNIWRFQGETLRVLDQALHTLDEDQIAALIAARGLLHLPNSDDMPTERPDMSYRGTLAKAIDRLLHEAGLSAEARAIAPDAVVVSRFGVATEEDAIFPIVLSAIRTGESIRFTYTNLAGATHPVYAKPVKLAHIVGEWHLLAWAHDNAEKPGKLKQYRLSRMSTIVRVAASPAGCPQAELRGQAMLVLRDAFRATGSTRPGARKVIDLGISPRAWPFIQNRRWGADQTIDATSMNLPKGWRRLRFSTTGIEEARHWVLSFGAEIRVFGPQSLATWIQEQAVELVVNWVKINPAAATAGNVRRLRT